MVLSEDNKVIHGLWVGSELSALELLTLNSFVANGHHFYLWVYEEIKTPIPEQVILKEAELIIPSNQIFRRKYNDPNYHIGKGSIGSPFSDLFRYKLLYEYGGWWVDMDVTCLKPFDINQPYFFRAHPLLPLIGNVIKTKPESELMKLAYEATHKFCDENTLDWLLPNKILNKYVEDLNMRFFIRDDLSVADWWEKVEKYILTNEKIPDSWYFIHWMNEEWRVRNIDKNRMFQFTALGNLAEKYGMQTTKYPLLNRLKNEFTYLFS